jgi:Putative prokaryotic signal transducing protein
VDATAAGQRVRIVYEAENIIDANLVKNVLENEGIVAFVSGQYLTGAAGELPPLALVKVMVAEIDWPRARAIAESVDADLAERRAAPDSGEDWLSEPA